MHPSAKRKAFGLWIFRILKLRAQSFLKLITIIIAIYPKIIFLFIAALSISTSRQVSSLGVVTRCCHTTTHLRCNGEVLPDTHSTLKILIIVRLPFVGSSIFTPKISKPDFSTMVLGILQIIPQNKHLSLCGLWESTQVQEIL